MLHGADDGIDHDFEARGHDGFVAGVGDGRVGDCVPGKGERGSAVCLDCYMPRVF